MNTRLLLTLGLLAVLAVVGLAVFMLFDAPAPESVEPLDTPDISPAPISTDAPLESTPEAPQALSRPARTLDEGDEVVELGNDDAWGAVTARVVDPDGLPVADAVVASFLSGDGRPFRTRRDLDALATTDGDGRFTIDGLPAGTPCGVEISSGRHAPTLREPFVVAADETLDLGTLLVKPGVSVTGTVSDVRSGAVLRDVVVELRDLTTAYRRTGTDLDDAPALATAVTDENGVYRFEHLAPRQYGLAIHHDGYIPLSSVLTFVLAMGDIPAKQDFALERATERVDGNVISAIDGTAVAGVKVRLSRNQVNQKGYYAAEAITDDTGAFTLAGLPAGRLTLELRSENWFLPITQGIEAPASNLVVEARPAQRVDVTLVVPEGRELPDEVTATVKPTPGGGGALVPSATARRVYDDLGDGAFSVTGLRHGKYRLEVAADGFAVTMSPQFELLRGTGSTSVVVALSAGSTIRGRLQPPQAGASIELRTSDYDPALSIESTFPTPPVHGLRTTTDEEGAFEIGLVPADVYVLSARPQGAPPVHVFDLEVQEGSVVDLGVLEVLPGGVVVGQVLGPDGQPRQGTRVLVSSADHHAQTNTDAQGAFRLDAVPPGTYEITATPGAANFWEALRYEAREQVTVTAGQTSRVTLTLSERERRG